MSQKKEFCFPATKGQGREKSSASQRTTGKGKNPSGVVKGVEETSLICSIAFCFPTSHTSGRIEASIAAISLQSDSITMCCRYADHLPQGETTKWWEQINPCQLQGGAWGLSDSWSEINALGIDGKQISFPESLALDADEKFCSYSVRWPSSNIRWWDLAISCRSGFCILTL